MDLQEQLKKYLELCYRFLTVRNRSEKEISDYLIRKQAEPEMIAVIIEKLRKQKFLDDEVFARGWVRSRARFRPRGKQLLKIELIKKGISKELIEQVLNEDNEELPDELTQAKNLIEKRIARMKGATRQEIYNKIGAFLARRGFNWETIKKAIDSSLLAKDE